ncbi:MAG: beta strand repeat-containing protein, partial [Limisphaerales bacterium]
LVIYPTQAADAATVANGDYVVAQDPCGNVVTSTPNASLTLTPPRNLVWVGGNPDNNWEYTETNFTVSGTPTTFMDGDNVTFDDTSANKTVTITTNLVPTSVTVNSASGYTFNGTGKLTGFGKLVDVGSGNVTIVNDFASKYDYTGGTIVSNGATLTFGDGASINGSVGGIVTVSSGGTLNYNYAGSGTANSPVNLNNGLASSGTVNYNDVNGSILATPLEIISSNFNGTINIQGFTALHASDNNAGYALGDGSTVNVPPNTQVWLDRSATAYNNTFNIAGTGWLGATPGTGAMRVYNCTINGPINLMDNARIGGSINGATIQSVISGDYQLEIYGNTNSFVLVMGPTNGSPQAYTSTLITSGAIRAVNTNAISTGPLTIDQGGDMQLYGNDITVANLSSIDSGVNTVIEGPRVRNMSATTAATLTVGTDGANSEFDGTFSDGAAAPLGVTKVGAGTLTLTGVNTNTGAVTVSGGTIAMSGSGSFNTASAIAIGSGAFYDVSGAGGTLTLNTSQTLQGNGTLAGTLDASAAGSTVAPGLPMGTLTVSGNATISGAYRANLNRTNSPSNCSKLTSSGGTVTYSGAALSVTNVGPKLQAGDVFQLFSGATSGFSAFNLQTNDPVNNAVYTWDNTITSDGRITVAGVSTLVNTNPTNIVATVSGGSLTLTWPMDHTGWTLQVQTNSLNVGLSTNWVNVPGSSLINSVTNAINQTNGSVFYRLIYNP